MYFPIHKHSVFYFLAILTDISMNNIVLLVHVHKALSQAHSEEHDFMKFLYFLSGQSHS